MNFHSYKIENDYYKFYSNTKWLRNSSTRRFLKMLMEDGLSVFHSHFINHQLLHIVFIFPIATNDPFQNFINGLYDVDKNIFWIEDNEELFPLLEENTFFRQLIPTKGSMPSDEIVKIIEKKTII